MLKRQFFAPPSIYDDFSANVEVPDDVVGGCDSCAADMDASGVVALVVKLLSSMDFEEREQAISQLKTILYAPAASIVGAAEDDDADAMCIMVDGSAEPDEQELDIMVIDDLAPPSEQAESALDQIATLTSTRMPSELDQFAPLDLTIDDDFEVIGGAKDGRRKSPPPKPTMNDFAPVDEDEAFQAGDTAVYDPVNPSDTAVSYEEQPINTIEEIQNVDEKFADLINAFLASVK